MRFNDKADLYRAEQAVARMASDAVAYRNTADRLGVCQEELAALVLAAEQAHKALRQAFLAGCAGR